MTQWPSITHCHLWHCGFTEAEAVSTAAVEVAFEVVAEAADGDLKSYSRWHEYTRARDEMFLKTDTAWAPWRVAQSDDKKRVRLNVITHLLGQIPYEKTPTAKIELPKRDKAHGYVEVDCAPKLIPEVF
jgi:hypothetical protein